MAGTTTPPTLADLIEHVQTAGLSAIQTRDRVSAIRTAARVLGADPKDLPMNVKLLRKRLEEVSPEAIGMTIGRWNNVRTLLNRALEMRTAVRNSRQTIELIEDWRILADRLSKSTRLRMSALLKDLSARGVTPSNVSLADLEAFRNAIIENRLRANAEKTWDGICWAWNKCTSQVPGWPQVTIPREDRRIVYVLPWAAFPPSYKADVDAYLEVLAGTVLDEDGPIRALRPTTLKMRSAQLRAAASALVTTGTPASEIRSIADVARFEPMKAILTHLRDRGTGGHSKSAFNMANALKAAARYRVKVGREELEKIGRMTSRLASTDRGMTEKNYQRLLPLNDPEEVRKFLNLPFMLQKELMATGRRTVVDAITAQIAVAIAILQVAPIRMKNLASIDVYEHLRERSQRVYLHIPLKEVKNELPYELEVPEETADLIAWYCRDYRPLLVHSPTNALFPSGSGVPKNPGELGRQISARFKKYLGWPVHPHLIRHIAAKIYLDRNPGGYATVSRFLNHKSVQTTMKAYTGAETVSAGRHFQSLVSKLRDKASSAPTARRKATP